MTGAKSISLLKITWTTIPFSGYLWGGFFSLVVKWPGRETDLLSAPSAKDRDNFTYFKPVKGSQLFLSLNQEAPWWFSSYFRLKCGVL